LVKPISTSAVLVNVVTNVATKFTVEEFPSKNLGGLLVLGGLNGGAGGVLQAFES